MLIDIKDCNFSTSKPCELCSREPVDYWQMFYIKYKTGMVGICTNCLGYVVCNMDIVDKYGKVVHVKNTDVK